MRDRQTYVHMYILVTSRPSLDHVHAASMTFAILPARTGLVYSWAGGLSEQDVQDLVKAVHFHVIE